jgi:hypothetical protein
MVYLTDHPELRKYNQNNLNNNYSQRNVYGQPTSNASAMQEMNQKPYGQSMTMSETLAYGPPPVPMHPNHTGEQY